MLKKEVPETKQEQNVDVEVMILSSLAKPEALKIFAMCEVGIESSTEAIKNLCLTQKCYYTNLKRLIDAGLVERRGRIYTQTALGKFCSKIEKEISRAISQQDQLQLTDKLMKSNTFSTEEKEKIIEVISDKDLKLAEIRMITNYDKFIEDVIRMFNNTKNTCYIAAAKSDLRVSDALLSLVDRGVNFFYLSGKRNFSESMEILRAVLNPKLIKTLRSTISSKQFNFRVKDDLPFSFVVSDGECGLLELPLHDIYIAYEFKSESIAQKLIEAFTVLYEQGKEDPRISFFNKYLSFYK